MDKVKQFEKELDYIKNNTFKEDAKTLIDGLPEYFFKVAASSTGKYHPKYALGEGGLLRHTKAAVRIAHELLENPLIGDKYSSDEKDLIIISLMLHDGLKHGLEGGEYTKFEHPLIAAEYIRGKKEFLKMNEENINFMCEIISSHMGVWNKDYDGNEVLPIPKNKYQNFVHMCDYLASRKAILFEFDSDNNILEV